ncbi:MAG: hypothetical protein ABF917_06270 [Gluconobacter oxydans]
MAGENDARGVGQHHRKIQRIHQPVQMLHFGQRTLDQALRAAADEAQLRLAEDLCFPALGRIQIVVRGTPCP